MDHVQQSPVAPVAVEARLLWVPSAQARDKMRATKDELLSAVRDGVPVQLVGADGRRTEVPPEDLPRVMMDGEQTRAWLMQPSGGTTAIAPSVGPDPEWGQPFLVHLGKLSAHLEELAKLYDPPIAAKRSQGGRPPHGAWLVALAEAARFMRWEGMPLPVSRLVRHMKDELTLRGIECPDDRTLQAWAKVVCDTAERPIDGAAV